MMRFYLFFCISFICPLIYANIVPSIRYSDSLGYVSGTYATPESVCNAIGSARMEAFNKNVGPNYVVYSSFAISFINASSNPGLCTIVFSGVLPSTGAPSSSARDYNFRWVFNACPDNSELSGGSCVCSSGFNEENGQCVPPSPCDGLENFCTGLKGPASSFTYSGKVVVPDTLCYPINDYGSCNKGCSASASGMSVTYVNSDGVLVTSTKLNFPGGTCDGPALPQEKPEPKPHECVGDYGVVNGVSTCIPVKEATGDTQKTETTNPDGSKSESTTETTCKDGKCTTTETKTNTDAGGNSSSGGSTTTTQGQGEYCKKNPASKVCDAVNGKPGSEGEGEEGEEGKGSFGGSCGSWQCDGDAIACAIAKRQHDDSCKLLDESNLDGTFSGAVDGSDGKNTDAMKSGATEIGISSFNQSGFGWGSSCPADPSISLEFVEASFEIPFSRICGPLSVLSLAGLGITLLGCLVWVLGGRKQ